MKKVLMIAAAVLFCFTAQAAEQGDASPVTVEKASVFVLDDNGGLRLAEGDVADAEVCKIDADRAGYKEPVFLVDDNGGLSLTSALTRADGSLEVRKCLSGPCNGGTCVTAAGVVLSCPATGGPSCSSSEECACDCSSGNAVNTCS